MASAPQTARASERKSDYREFMNNLNKLSTPSKND